MLACVSFFLMLLIISTSSSFSFSTFFTNFPFPNFFFCVIDITRTWYQLEIVNRAGKEVFVMTNKESFHGISLDYFAHWMINFLWSRNIIIYIAIIFLFPRFAVCTHITLCFIYRHSISQKFVISSSFTFFLL